MAEESFLGQVKRLIVGAPIPSHLAHHERFSRVTGLAVLSSDPLSSVAYATEEILRVLTIGGVAALSLVTPIGAVIATMLAIVVFSYRQTIHAYPNGGGAYIVAKENLGTTAGAHRRRVAADRLRADRRRQHRGGRRGDHLRASRTGTRSGRAVVWDSSPILMFGNLRGIRESGRLFAGADLLLHRQHPRDDRRRRMALLHRDAAARADAGAPAARRARRHAAARSCCSRRSRTAARR